MPELPEVENLRIGLEKNLIGQKIERILVHKPKLVSGKSTKREPSKKKVLEFISSLEGEKFTAVERRAKNLIFKLTHKKILLVHLKMTGQFVYEAKNQKEKILGGHPIEISETKLPNKHTHVIFKLDNGVLYYNDTRMFGYLLYFDNESKLQDEKHFEKLGAEPMSEDFSLKYFSEKLKDKKAKIKALLLNQDIVVGVGNIYADESLFESGIRPDRTASSLKPEEIKKLYMAIKKIIKRAISVGGSSVATYRLLDNTRGNYAREHKVYGKAGQKCVICHSTLQKMIIQSRTTVFCPKCQK